MAQRLVFSTHDWTPFVTFFPNPTANPFVETWVDVKTPGGMPRFDQIGGGLIPDQRRTYCVGTIEVNTTLDTAYTFPATPTAGAFTVPPAQFSGEPVGWGGLLNYGFAVASQTDRRQIVIVQCNQTDRGTDALGNPDENGIVWQEYFYGESTQAPPSELPDFTRSTNARAISVWEDDDPLNARVAICGETWDERVPLAPDTDWNGDLPSGFIAVYDGNGQLLWTRHLFADTDPGRECAVTDLSIRVEPDGEGMVDVVTYCGVTRHGNPGPNNTLSPIRPFASPAFGLNAGDAALPGGQWDGFVGRVRSDDPVAEFHSIVGGPGQDGLFGLAEINADRFVVVGSAQAVVGQEGFPVAELNVATLTAPYQIGVALVFDTSQVAGGGPLVLDSGMGLGSSGLDVATIARDVCVGHEVALTVDPSGTAITQVGDVLYVAGSTTDGSFGPTNSLFFQSDFDVAPDPAAGGTFGGVADGFVAVLQDVQGATMWPYTFTYWGGEGDDGLNGVNCYNEFPEHIAVVGFTPGEAGAGADIGATTYLLDNAYGPGIPAGSTATPNNSGRLHVMRETLIGGTSDDRPALMGFENATDLTDGVPTDGPFLTYQLGQSAAGGGVSVANDGRVTVVGRTNPVGGLFPVEGLNARAEDSGMDAVRTDVDMVPQSITAVGGALPGVARTDGTGFQGAGATFPIAGFTGGTTPECGLSPYGRRIGEPEPAVARMLIDYEGTAPALGVTDAAIVISRPATVSGSITMGVLWLGFPAAAGPTSVVDGVEFWADPASWVFLIDVWSEERAYRMPLNPFGPNPGTMSVQLHCLLDATPGSGPLGFTRVTHGPGCASEFVASPALWLSF